MLAVRHENPIEEAVKAQPAAACDHQRELAELLVRHLGPQGAARACRENHWQGVMKIVESLSAAH